MILTLAISIGAAALLQIPWRRSFPGPGTGARILRPGGRRRRCRRTARRRIGHSAAEALVRLGEAFPATEHEAFWEAAQIYDRRLDDGELAAATYRRVPRASRYHDRAERRLSKLD